MLFLGFVLEIKQDTAVKPWGQSLVWRAGPPNARFLLDEAGKAQGCVRQPAVKSFCSKALLSLPHHTGGDSLPGKGQNKLASAPGFVSST